MREIQTITTHQLAHAIAKAEEGGNVNQPPSPARVDTIADRLNDIVAEVNSAKGRDPLYRPEALRGDQPAVLQSRYFAKRDAGSYGKAYV